MSNKLYTMSVAELKLELRDLTILRNSTIRCMEDEPEFRDEASEAMLADIDDELIRVNELLDQKGAFAP